jgi:ribosomal protein S18 acetylase RimI-like enzyme
MATIRETARETAPEPPIIVRAATEADRVAAMGLIAPLAARGRGSLALLRAGQGLLWVAVEHADDAGATEKLVGLLLAAAQIEPETGELVGYIHELLVHPAYRRRGVAMSLLDAAERGMLVDGEFSLVYVLTSFDNQAALRLYRSRGYSLSQARLARRRGDPGARIAVDGETSDLIDM